MQQDPKTAVMASTDGTEPSLVSRANLSTLPWGPLENAVLFLKEGDFAQVLAMSKEFSTLHSDDFWRERCCDTFGQHLTNIENLSKDAMKAMLDTERHALKGLSRSRMQLLSSCEGSSTRDHFEEGPEHTLQESPCGQQIHQSSIMAGRPISISPLLGQRFQAICGCWREDKCYWSSAPSAKSDKDDWIEYRMAEGLAVVTSLVICPYTSYWQPNQPTYNPVEACVQLYHSSINEEKPYYESPRFRVAGSMMPQQFDLPKPVLSLGGRAKLLLFGMAQRQTLGEHAGDTANHYYVCISHVALRGAKLPSYRLDETVPDSAVGVGPLELDQAYRKLSGNADATSPQRTMEDFTGGVVSHLQGEGAKVPPLLRLARVLPVLVQLRVPVPCDHDKKTRPDHDEGGRKIFGNASSQKGSVTPALKLPCCYVEHKEWEIHISEYTACQVLLNFCSENAGLALEDVRLVEVSTGRVVVDASTQSVGDAVGKGAPMFVMLCPKWDELAAAGTVGGCRDSVKIMSLLDTE